MRSEEVKKRNLAITSMSAMLLTTVAISMITTDNAFAGNERYASEVSQAASSETGTPQQACEECIDVLNATEHDNFLERVRQEIFTENPPMTNEEFCTQMNNLNEDDLQAAFEDISFILEEMVVERELDQATQVSIFRCFTRALG